MIPPDIRYGYLYFPYGGLTKPTNDPLRLIYGAQVKLINSLRKIKMHAVRENNASNGGKREGYCRKRGAGAIKTQEISKAFIETNQKTPLDIILMR